MGDISKILGLSSTAGGVPEQGTPQDANSNMSDAVMGMPSVFMGRKPQGAITETGAIPGRQEDAVVSGWQPKHRTTLGTIADIFLTSQGGDPIFKNKIDRENMDSAVKGFQQDPKEAIRRISKLDPAAGLRLQNEYEDNGRLQGNLDRQNRIFDLRLEQDGRNGAAGMMSVPGLAENPEAFSRMRKGAIKYGLTRGVDLTAEIPETYDKLDVDALRYGQIAPKAIQQMQDNKDYRGSRLGQIDRAEAGRNTRFATGQDRQDNRTAAQIAATNKRAADALAARPKPKGSDISLIETKYGKGLVSGNQMTIIRGGNKHRYIRVGHQWVPYEVVPVSPVKE